MPSHTCPQGSGMDPQTLGLGVKAATRSSANGGGAVGVVDGSPAACAKLYRRGQPSPRRSRHVTRMFHRSGTSGTKSAMRRQSGPESRQRETTTARASTKSVGAARGPPTAPKSWHVPSGLPTSSRPARCACLCMWRAHVHVHVHWNAHSTCHMPHGHAPRRTDGEAESTYHMPHATCTCTNPNDVQMEKPNPQNGEHSITRAKNASGDCCVLPSSRTLFGYADSDGRLIGASSR